MVHFIYRITAEDIQKMSVKEIEKYLVEYGNRTYEEAYHNALVDFKHWFEITEEYLIIRETQYGEYQPSILDIADIIGEFQDHNIS